MKLIGTHDSATGEKPTWWSALLTPFARTQDKSIGTQFADGCSLFDIRVKKVFGVWRCAHGWWFTQRTFDNIIDELGFYANCGQKIRISITYEGKTKNADEFVEYIKQIKRQYPNIKFGPVCAKYGSGTKWLKVKYSEPLIPEDDEWCPYHCEKAYLPLDGHSWHTYLPIPRLWKRFYYRKVDFCEDKYKWVDFF